MHSTNPIYLVRPWINIKKFCHEKKQMNWAKKPAASDFFHIHIVFLNFRDSFGLVQRAFPSVSIMFLEINFVPN